MAENTTNSCCCEYDREEIELQEQRDARIVIVDEDCDCSCSEIELYTDRGPKVVLFDEYTEQYIDDIVSARVAAEEARDAVETSAATIIAKENLLLDDHQTIKRELRKGFDDVLSGIAAAKDVVLDGISSAVASVKSYMDGKVSDILAAIQTSQFQTFEDASDADIDAMFDGLSLPEED